MRREEFSEVTAFLPCRKGSERIPNKNTRPFSADGKSLLEIKLAQLLEVEAISKVVLSSDDHEVFRQAQAFSSPKLIAVERPPYLANSQTEISALARYAGSLVETTHVLWTHVTSPLFGAADYSEAIERFGAAWVHGADSMISVRKHQGFFLKYSGNGRYLEAPKAWPRTQDVEPIFEVDSAVFICERRIMADFGLRAGERPIAFESNLWQTMDVDWPEDFEFAQKLWDSHSSKQ